MAPEVIRPIDKNSLVVFFIIPAMAANAGFTRSVLVGA